MKKTSLLFLGLLTLVFFTSCEKNDRIKPLKPEKAVKTVKMQLVDMAEFPTDGCGSQTYDLIAGKYNYAGSVETILSSDGMILFVKYKAFDNCEITEAHLFVGHSAEVIPAGKSGNPKIGHFPYAWEGAGEDEVIFSIPVGSLDLIDDCFKIAAHAVVICDGKEETAWARGSDLVFSLKVYVGEDESERAITATGPITGNDWLSHMRYYPLAEALAGPITLVSIEDGTTPMGTAEVVPDGAGNHELIITANSGEILKTYIFIGPEEAFNLDIQFGWTLIDNWNDPVNPLAIPVSISDVLSGQEFDGSRWGWYVDYCPSLCLND